MLSVAWRMCQCPLWHHTRYADVSCYTSMSLDITICVIVCVQMLPSSAVSQDFTPSSARAFCTILDVFRVMVREMTLRHFFPSLLPLFNTSSDTPSGPCNSRKRALVISTVSAQQTETGGCMYCISEGFQTGHCCCLKLKKSNFKAEWSEVKWSNSLFQAFLRLKLRRVNFNADCLCKRLQRFSALLAPALRTSCLHVAAVIWPPLQHFFFWLPLPCV